MTNGISQLEYETENLDLFVEPDQNRQQFRSVFTIKQIVCFQRHTALVKAEELYELGP